MSMFGSQRRNMFAPLMTQPQAAPNVSHHDANFLNLSLADGKHVKVR